MIDIFYFEDGVKKGELSELEKLKDKQLWIDISGITKKEAELIKNTFDLHPLTAEDLSSSRTRIKIEEFPNYLFCVFYSMQKNRSIELVELDMILGKNFFISNHVKPADFCDALKNNKERLESLFKKGSEFIFHYFLDVAVDNYFPIIEYIDDQFTDIEDHVTKNPRPEMLERILKLKQNIIIVKKVAFPQRDKIANLTKEGHPFISKKAAPYFRDVHDHAIRVYDAVENHREAVANTFEVYMSAVSNNMNEIMKVLSIIATIFLPLTVISSIYGTNFRVLPGAASGYGFWIMIALMVVVSGGLIYSFKRRGWF